MAKGMLKAKYGVKGDEVKVPIGIKAKASVWNKAREKAEETGISLNSLITNFLLNFINDENSNNIIKK